MADGGVGEVALISEIAGTGAMDAGVGGTMADILGTSAATATTAGGVGAVQSMSGIPSLVQQAVAQTPAVAEQLAGINQAAQTANLGQQVAQFGQTGIPQAFNPITQIPQVPVVDMAGTPVAQTVSEIPTARGGVNINNPVAYNQSVPRPLTSMDVYENALQKAQTQPFSYEFGSGATNVPTSAGGSALDMGDRAAESIMRQGPASDTTAQQMVAEQGNVPSANKSLLDKFMAQPLQNQLLMGSLGLQALPVIAPMLKNLFGGSSGLQAQEKYSGPLSKYKFVPGGGGYNPAPPTPYTPQYTNYRTMADGGQVPSQSFFSAPFNNAPTAPMQTGGQAMSNGLASLQPSDLNDRYAQGGLSHLGSYSDGGRMLKGPGDGMSDSIPATINNKQPARLANDEFVVPADVVSHLGNGSSDAGAKQLYKMMDKVRSARTGTKKQGKQINPSKYLPA